MVIDRDTLDKIYAHIFGAGGPGQIQIVSGTHAISLCLFGILRPGDRLLAVTGQPYDTLLKVIGHPLATPCSLKNWVLTIHKSNCCLTAHLIIRKLLKN